MPGAPAGPAGSGAAAAALISTEQALLARHDDLTIEELVGIAFLLLAGHAAGRQPRP
ncbi:hypothetical protein [Streptomyces sp. YGL11-2]|uniref:hypothetical protein n=1 Tax=Streptomyces sp. YGL11-2 TaxID=3414028 RepID=UPI003CF2EBC2